MCYAVDVYQSDTIGLFCFMHEIKRTAYWPIENKVLSLDNRVEYPRHLSL